MDDKAIIESIETALQEAILNVRPETVLDYKRMFGGAGYYADGRIFAGWFGKGSDSIALKLSPEDGEALLKATGTKSGMMPGYIEIPASMLNDTDKLSPWVEKSLNYVASLPEKKKKTKKK
jgi:TfoX/Sxy family transcriptional regulator of competence genes